MEVEQTSDDKPTFSGRSLGLVLMNPDIMTFIARRLPGRSDISCFMRACQAFHTIGAPALLSHGDIFLQDKETLESLHAFMHSEFHETPRRLFPYIREFWLLPERLFRDAQAMKMLSDILPNCTHLRYFDSEYMEKLLAFVPALFNTLCIQPNLTELLLHDVGKRGTELIATMRAPVLRRLECGMDEPHGPIHLLQFKHFCSTLTVLKISSGYLDFDDLPLNLVFPLLLDLDIRVYTTVPSARIFRAFPNVKRMELRELYGPNDEDWDRLYGQSTDELEMYDGPRPSFDVVKGEGMHLDSCALYCPIKTLLIDVVTVEKVDHIVNLVQTCHVSTLRVELEGFEECNEALAHLSFELARIPVQTLKTFWVEIEFDSKDVNELREVATVLPRRLAALRLESCSINLVFRNRYQLLSKKERNLDLFREFNWDQFAESVVRLNPTLREIECQGSDLTRFGTTWIVKDKGKMEKKVGANDIDPFSGDSFRLEIEKAWLIPPTCVGV